MIRNPFSIICVSLFTILAIACQKIPPHGLDIEPPTPVVEVVSTAKAYSCADVDSYWGQDWPTTLIVLEELVQREVACGPEPLSSKQYAAYFSYANALETAGDLELAIENYQQAFFINSNRAEALAALSRLDALPTPTPAPCVAGSKPFPDPTPSEIPDETLFVQARGNQLFWKDEPFQIRGVNYYPRHAPWHHFLLEADVSEIEQELDLIQQAGFNTLRIFLWYDPLFTCLPESAIPNEEVFARLDHILQLARERDLKLILTLNDLPDLTFRPLYTDWARYDAQTLYIIRRYRNESAILAWDLRNEGDLDYGARTAEEAQFDQSIVLDWLAHVSQLVRENDPYHLITAGWWGDPTNTAEYVDILSFHHWSDTLSLQARIDDYVARNHKPILLEEIGYHSWQDAPQDARTALVQADLLGNATHLVEEAGLAGWMIWTAFDFVPEQGQPPVYEHFFGVWQVDLTPKPALGRLFAETQ